TLLTFGGAWSNHIYATAAAARHFGFNSIGIIRGEKYSPLNATLSFAEKCGMQLHYLSRTEYRQKHEDHYQQKLKQQFGNVYILPEGGSNALAMRGCAEIVGEINSEISKPFDVICCASGTGATLAGLITAIDTGQEAIGFSALKGGGFLNDEVKKFLNRKDPGTNWRIETDFHFGGYAKINDELIEFLKEFQSRYDIPLDAVYTGKMFYGLFKLIEAKTFKPGTSIVVIHSGGLQGNKGFNL
ncbi:MAG: pyridoxal-phosphate dependent enzyme, partial [Proteobacteria bacterium]|nr:pyridoxal-phosphate dependent enzyme [Pseudomonadota bacterium]